MATEPLPPPCDWPRERCHFTGEIQSLREKNDALRAEVERLRADAERLDWLQRLVATPQVDDWPWNQITLPVGVPVRESLDRMRNAVPTGESL